MYIPKHFEVLEREEILKFLEANPFGQLISTIDGKLFSTHLPFFLDDDIDSLICHVAIGNPQWKDIEGQEVLVTFQGPHDYISPSWYDSPGVPTWNYQAVHVYGKPKIITDSKKLKSMAGNLTEIHESSFDDPWEPDYKESLLNGIVGIEITVTDLQCKYKLSQNRTEKDKKEIIEQVEKRGSTNLSKAMKSDL